MRIPATEEARQALDEAVRVWRPGADFQYSPRVARTEPYHLVLIPHAADMYFALKLRSLRRRLEKNPPKIESGAFVVPTFASVEAGLRFRWGIESIESACEYLKSAVIAPVRRAFPRLAKRDELSESDCYIQLMNEIIPDTKPPHIEAWPPDPRKQLAAYWRKALRNDVLDSAEWPRGKAGEPRFILAAPDLMDRRFGETSVTWERLDLTAEVEALGEYAKYLPEDATPESLGVSRTTFYDRRAKGRALWDAKRPGAAQLLPARRKKVPPPPE